MVSVFPGQQATTPPVASCLSYPKSPWQCNKSHGELQNSWQSACWIGIIYRGFHNWGYPQMVGLYGKISYKWMMTGGTPISGNHHIIYKWTVLHSYVGIQDGFVAVPRWSALFHHFWQLAPVASYSWFTLATPSRMCFFLGTTIISLLNYMIWCAYIYIYIYI